MICKPAKKDIDLIRETPDSKVKPSYSEIRKKTMIKKKYIGKIPAEKEKEKRRLAFQILVSHQRTARHVKRITALTALKSA
jgi:hypothetical protein